MDKYQTIIGLEIHVELSTKSKMFCQCSADWFGKKPNTHVCPVCLGMPGALPVPNKKAVEWTIKIAKALGCTINKHSKFDRKHYFYPDLAKGYQISQYDEPIGVKGQVSIIDKNDPSKLKTFRIHRVHLEEDTGKLIHEGKETLIDFNRSSAPLVEIVTEADFDNSDDVKAFLEELQVIIRYLDVSDADMEKGSMRLEPNISVKPKTLEGFPPYKVEVKNINSFNYVKRAIEYEVKRHLEIIEDGKWPVQETRGYNEGKGITVSQRSKENAQDYRYFPEPDIPPMNFSDEFLKNVFSLIPEIPTAKVQRFMKQYGLRYQEAFILTRDRGLADKFEQILSKITGEKMGQTVANLIINKKVNAELDVENIIKKIAELSKPKETDTALLETTASKVIAANPKVVEDYKKGKQNAVMFLVGQVMKEMKGQADANTVKAKLVEKLS